VDIAAKKSAEKKMEKVFMAERLTFKDELEKHNVI
jgi:hypothetical protein